MCAKDIGPTNLETLAFRAETTGTEVEYRTLAPATLPDGPLPLILHLHGAMSSSASLDAARSAYEGAWASGRLPPAIVACASTPTHGGFYIDYPGGPRWQSLVVDELPRRLAGRYRLAAKVALMGFSMGGYGSLSAAFRHPERVLAVAALCPVIFPAETAEAVPPRNRPSVLNDLNEAMGGATPPPMPTTAFTASRGRTPPLSGRKTFRSSSTAVRKTSSICTTAPSISISCWTASRFPIPSAPSRTPDMPMRMPPQGRRPRSASLAMPCGRRCGPAAGGEADARVRARAKLTGPLAFYF